MYIANLPQFISMCWLKRYDCKCTTSNLNSWSRTRVCIYEFASSILMYILFLSFIVFHSEYCYKVSLLKHVFSCTIVQFQFGVGVLWGPHCTGEIHNSNFMHELNGMPLTMLLMIMNLNLLKLYIEARKGVCLKQLKQLKIL